MTSSILTNLSAMTAVQNLAATQQQLSQVQNEISTGLSISSAQDNAAYYSIAQTMRTNVSDLSAVSSSLNLGSSVISTGTAATSQLTSILQTISSDLTTAMSNVGNTSTQGYLQTAITGLSNQLSSIVNSASFNGVNLLNGSTNGSVSFVSGVTGTGSNTAITSINVDTTSTNLSGASYTTGTNALVDAANTATKAQATAQQSYDTAQTAFTNALASANGGTGLTATDYTSGDAAFKGVFGANATYANGTVSLSSSDSTAATALVGSGGTFTVSSGAVTGYTAGGTSSTGGALYALGGTSATGTTGSQTVTAGASGGAINATTAAVAAVNNNSTAAAIYNGGLFSISQISLNGSTSASQIQSFIQQVGTALTAVNGASETLGSAASSMTLQSTYISSLSDSLTSGVGSLVDADMNEASTRLNALQTQQQLGVQALSVANQNSQLILKLFGG